METDGSNAFFDTETTRQQDGSIAVSVHRKFPLTDRYLILKSHHHSQHKHSIVRTLMDCAENIPSTEEEMSGLQTKRMTQALSANSHPTNFFRKGHHTDQRLLLILPYAKGFSEEIARELKGDVIRDNF